MQSVITESLLIRVTDVPNLSPGVLTGYHRPMSLRKTALNAIHREFGGKMVEFAGWEMPVQYQGALKEHLAVRQAVGVFDVSHMGQLEIVGKDALTVAQKVTSNDISRLKDEQAQYSAFLNPNGTFIDDIVVYRINSQHIFICVNAANREKDYQWLKRKKQGDVQIQDSSDAYVLLAIQGPQSEALLQQLTDVDLSQIRYYRFTHGSVAGGHALISRTGYTGENGFEIYISPEKAEPIWRELFRVGEPLGVTAAGLAARNTLRLEMCYALYGNDIDDTTSPLESGLGWIVKLDKPDFIGQESLREQKKQGLQRKLISFEMVDRGIARDHFPVFVEQTCVGEVTSGSFSPSLKKNIGLTYLPIEKAEIDQLFHVEIRGKRLQARVVEKPFLKKKKE